MRSLCHKGGSSLFHGRASLAINLVVSTQPGGYHIEHWVPGEEIASGEVVINVMDKESLTQLFDVLHLELDFPLNDHPPDDTAAFLKGCSCFQSPAGPVFDVTEKVLVTGYQHSPPLVGGKDRLYAMEMPFCGNYFDQGGAYELALVNCQMTSWRPLLQDRSAEKISEALTFAWHALWDGNIPGVLRELPNQGDNVGSP